MDGGSVTTAAGTRFYISDDQVDGTLDGFRSIDNWVEVRQVESISEFGVESEDIVRMAIGQERGDHIKGVRSPVGLNVIVGHDPLDDGQDEFNIAEGFAVQFAFKIILPGEIDSVIYFRALVKSNKLGVGTVNDVVRRNYACTLNSEIVTDDNISHIITMEGAGRLSVYARQISVVAARLPGTGLLSTYVNQIHRPRATLAGAGGILIDVTVTTTNFLLLRNGVDRLLLRDGVSKLKLGH